MAGTDYEKYTRTDELLGLLPDRSKLAAHDELLFNISHLTAQLWMQAALHDAEEALRLLDRDEVWRAADLLDRVALIETHLTRELEIVERMAPKQYAYIRKNTWGRGSGKDSPGYIQMKQLGERIWPHVRALLERRRVKLTDILDEPERHSELHRLTRSLFDLDQWFQSWRFAHLQLAERILGAAARTTTGKRVDDLTPSTHEHLFPELWGAVADFTELINSRAERNGGRLHR